LPRSVERLALGAKPSHVRRLVLELAPGACRADVAVPQGSRASRAHLVLLDELAPVVSRISLRLLGHRPADPSMGAVGRRAASLGVARVAVCAARSGGARALRAGVRSSARRRGSGGCAALVWCDHARVLPVLPPWLALHDEPALPRSGPSSGTDL